MRKSLQHGGIFYGSDAPDQPPAKITVTRHGASYRIVVDRWPYGAGKNLESWARTAAMVRPSIRALGFTRVERQV